MIVCDYKNNNKSNNNNNNNNWFCCRLPSLCIPGLRGKPEVRRVLLALCCVGVAITWAIMRNEPYAWIAQDILGVMFCMNMMKTLRLPSLQVKVKRTFQIDGKGP